MTLISRIMKSCEDMGRRQALMHIRLMSDRQLADCGFSRALLDEGIKAWPWRVVPEEVVPMRLDQKPDFKNISFSKIQSTESKKEKATLQRHAA